MTAHGWEPVPYRMRLALHRQALKGGLLSEGVICECFHITGTSIDAALLDQAFRLAVTRHPALRTRFRVDPDHGAGQQIGEAWPSVLDVVRCEPGTDDPLTQARQYTNAHGSTPFDLTEGRLVRAVLFTDGATEHALAIAVDHTACDGVSFAQFIEDVTTAYRDPVSAVATHTAPDYTLIDYARAEGAYHEGAEGERLRKAWRERLSGGVPEMVLASRTPWQDLPSEGTQLCITGDAREFRAFQLAAAAMTVTPYMLAVAMLLDAMNDTVLSDELSFIAPLAGRIPGTPITLVGNLVNLVPVTIRRPDSGDIESLARAVREGVMWALRHQALPFAQVVAEVDPAGPVMAQQRRQIFISGQHRNPLEINGRPATQLPAVHTTALFDFSVWISTAQTGLTLDSIHRTALLGQAQVAGWLSEVATPPAAGGAR